jgi:hypothetical protein
MASQPLAKGTTVAVVHQTGYVVHGRVCSVVHQYPEMKFLVRARGMRRVTAEDGVYEILDTEWRAPQEELIVTEHEKLTQAASGFPRVRIVRPSNDQIRELAAQASASRRAQQGQRPQTQWVVARRPEPPNPCRQQVRPPVLCAIATQTSPRIGAAPFAQPTRLTRQNHQEGFASIQTAPPLQEPPSQPGQNPLQPGNTIQRARMCDAHTMTQAYEETERPEKPVELAESSKKHWTISCIRIPEEDSKNPPINDHHLVFPGSLIFVANEGTSASHADGNQGGGAVVGPFVIVQVGGKFVITSLPAVEK